jgi:Secretion system C-terminal sorting domain/Calx-beta domain
VYGVDMQGTATNIQFTIIDPTGGIGLFRSNVANPPAITLVPEEGDSVQVWGKVGEFNGLAQINLDSIKLVSKGNSLKAPRAITKLDETTESDLVIFNNAVIIDTLSSTGSGTTLRIVSGLDSMDLRIDADVSLFGQPFPARFNVIGLGGQFDNSNPKNSGYQLLPRKLEDVIAIVDPEVILDSATYSVSEATATKTVKLKLNKPAFAATSIELAVLGGSANPANDYTLSATVLVQFAIGETEKDLNISINNDTLVEGNETILLAIGNPVNCTVGSIGASTVTIIDNDFPVGVSTSKLVEFNMYPNPANAELSILSNNNIVEVQVINNLGQLVKSVLVNSTESKINIEELNAGIYTVVVIAEEGKSMKKLMVK